LYLIRRDGRGLERLTHAESFASFPMFSADGRRLVFCSSRGAAQPREFNVFVADWVD
jgi:Tol biopolymer transport system component